MNDTTWEWVLKGVGIVIATLAAVVGGLYKRLEGKNAKAIADQAVTITHLEKRSEDCEEDRNQMKIRIAVLETEQGMTEESD